MPALREEESGKALTDAVGFRRDIVACLPPEKKGTGTLGCPDCTTTTASCATHTDTCTYTPNA